VYLAPFIIIDPLKNMTIIVSITFIPIKILYTLIKRSPITGINIISSRAILSLGTLK